MGMAVTISDKRLTNRRRRWVSMDRMAAQRKEGTDAATSSSKAREGNQGMVEAAPRASPHARTQWNPA